jgi:allantoin racemase
MRILIINPNSTSSMTETILASARGVASTDAEVVGFTAPRGPNAIESYVDDAFAAPEVLQAIGSQKGFDAYVIACSNDPGLFAARELTEAPVVGVGEAAFLQACLLAPTFAVVTTLSRAVGQTWHQLDSYGLRSRCAAVLAAEVPVLETHSGADESYQALMASARSASDLHGAEAIALGCAGMSSLARRMESELRMPVIDGVAAAVSMAEGLVRCGHHTSKAITYAWPVDVVYKGVKRPF